jgi:hypothetical protein
MIDPVEHFISGNQSIADTAGTVIKATVAEEEVDQEFVYKKKDNFIVLLFKLRLPDQFRLEE